MARFRETFRTIFRRHRSGGDDGKASARNDMLFRRIEKEVTARELYLNPALGVDDLAGAVCSNRTYVTSALSSRGFTFPAYINSFRVLKVVSLLLDKSLEDADACRIAELSGFQSDRSMSYHISKTFGVSFSTLRNRIRAAD